MNRSIELRRYCRDNSYKLERCRRKGVWMVGFDKRPTYDIFVAFIHNVKKMGYGFFQDCEDPDGSYWVQITTKAA